MGRNIQSPNHIKLCKSIALMLLFHLSAHAQISRLGENIQFHTSATGVASSGDTSPFWFSNNRYGLGTPNNNFGYVRVRAKRDAEEDSLRHWRIGYGADVVGAVGMQSYFNIQQLYADFQWKMIRLSVGQKERPLELKNSSLSSGGMTMGINARPLPQVRFELPDFWCIPGTKNWLALKAHIAYGMYTDNKWQSKFNAGSTYLYTANSFYHSKAGFLRVGNKDVFPLTLTAGLEMSAQFGGEAWNLGMRTDEGGGKIAYTKLPGGIKAFWNAFIPGGSDVTDGDYANVGGNQVGSWHARLDYHGKGWQVGVYFEHFFEDHSSMFFLDYDGYGSGSEWNVRKENRYVRYALKDFQLGLDATLPRNPFVSQVVYEYINTRYQSGPINHDHTPNVSDHIGGQDDYYNHGIYGAWQHAGFVMGNPLLRSPIYNDNHAIQVMHNRIQAHHIGLSGNPLPNLCWRILYSHAYSLGTYRDPLPDPARANYLMIEGSYELRRVPGLSITCSYGHNDGEIMGKSNGGMLTIAYNRIFNKK
ncbi:MAG: hypothetical protein HUK03_05100 [Bacteroidaceae bacterium]|nr:hypothetical protein [Bacteroidaceae bacterium]